MAHAEQRVRADEVRAQGQEGLGTVAHLQESSPTQGFGEEMSDGDWSEKKKNKRLTLIESQHCTYFNKSLGTCCNTLPKLLTVSARLAFLEKSKCVHVRSYLNLIDTILIQNKS